MTKLQRNEKNIDLLFGLLLDLEKKIQVFEEQLEKIDK